MNHEIVRVRFAPGLTWKKRRGGIFEARWQARESILANGYTLKSVKIWSGAADPSLKEWNFIVDTCAQLQQEMLVWQRGDMPASLPVSDGTLASIAKAYCQDPDSGYRKLRYKSRTHYDVLIRLIMAEYGGLMLSAIKGRTFLRWHEAWSAGDKISIAHSKIAMLRIIFGYGKTMLEDDDCKRLSEALSGQRFKMPKPREQFLAVEQADAIRATAHTMKRPSLALAQAFQFECTFRQMDVIGQWVPMKEAGASDVIFVDPEEGINEKWLRGIRWSEIDANLVLRHITSKRQKAVTIHLKLAPMVLDELARQYDFDPMLDDRTKLPASGPIIVSEWSGIPWTAVEYRRWWRKMANACGIPKEVRNMDSRAGAISEATGAGASLEMVRHAATHSNVSMTARYSRDGEEKTAQVMQIRSDSRKKNDR